MKVKALVTFTGAYSMVCGDTGELPDKVAADLARYALVEITADTPAEKTADKPVKKASKKKAVKADEDIGDNAK